MKKPLKKERPSKKENPYLKARAWVVSVSMGYGHQRTAYPLRSLSPSGKVINANNYEGILEADRKIWEGTRRAYEFISDFKRFPLFGNFIFSVLDFFQKILNFYPKRDLSKPNFALKQIFSLIKNNWGRDLVEKLKDQKFLPGSFQNLSKSPKNIPLITTFFTPAFMAESFGYPGEIFCVICDADMNRAWASLNPSKSRIKYFAPTKRTAERLKLYGVRESNIFLTGYPLPLDIIGNEKMAILKNDLGYRLLNLDPKKEYSKKYKELIKDELGKLPESADHPLTIMFSVGGAGAQKEIALKAVKSLSREIKRGQIKMILSAGIREKVKEYFIKNVTALGLASVIDKNIRIIYEEDINKYFQSFNEALRKVDILWTKPSELSFYSALGIPIIISPTIGSQEDFNQNWLTKSGFGISQENPDYTHQWLFDWLDQGYLAEAAIQGFVEGEQLGALKIDKIISSQKK